MESLDYTTGDAEIDAAIDAMAQACYTEGSEGAQAGSNAEVAELELRARIQLRFLQAKHYAEVANARTEAMWRMLEMLVKDGGIRGE
jgi:hypothetical protein